MRISSYGSGYPLDFGSGVDAHERRVLTVNGTQFDGLDEAMQAFPEIGTEEFGALYCEAWLRLHHGSGYRVIRDPEDFKYRYRNLSRRGRGTNNAYRSSTEYGVYNVSEVCAPELLSDVLRCYVEDRQHGVPYRVDLPWPARTEAVVEFVLLPMEDGEDEEYI